MTSQGEGMIRVKMKFENTKIERIVRCLVKQVSSEFNIWEYGNALYASFEVQSISDFNRLRRTLKRIRGLEFRYLSVKRVLSWWKRVLG